MAYLSQGQKVMVQPVNLIFRYLQNWSRIQVWLYEQVNMRLEGCIIGFDDCARHCARYWEFQDKNERVHVFEEVIFIGEDNVHT
uniref:Small nuclear ribonucleoprotein E n=1 Tax=Vombatus ursinus TaxID=29139 RepID=A0A4X2JR65_VOMUR